MLYYEHILYITCHKPNVYPTLVNLHTLALLLWVEQDTIYLCSCIRLYLYTSCSPYYVRYCTQVLHSQGHYYSSVSTLPNLYHQPSAASFHLPRFPTYMYYQFPTAFRDTNIWHVFLKSPSCRVWGLYGIMYPYIGIVSSHTQCGQNNCGLFANPTLACF
jgi:hypothetical protein